LYSVWRWPSRPPCSHLVVLNCKTCFSPVRIGLHTNAATNARLVVCLFSMCNCCSWSLSGMALRSTSISRPARVTSLRMADPLYEDNSDEEVAAKVKTASSKSGGVSDGMRAKLLRESQAMGGDPDAPSINFGNSISSFTNAILCYSHMHEHTRWPTDAHTQTHTCTLCHINCHTHTHPLAQELATGRPHV